MPINLIEQIFGIKLPKKMNVKPFDFLEDDPFVESLADEVEQPVKVAKPISRLQLSDVEMEALPTALRDVRDTTILGREAIPVTEAKPTQEFDTTVETEGQKFTRETGEFIKSPEFSYMLASLGASIGGKDSVGGKLGGFAMEQIQSSVYEDYRSALEAGEDVSKIPGVSLLPVAMKSQALKEKRAETELGLKEREVGISEEATGALSKYRDAATQKAYSDIEKTLPELERLEFQRGTKRMEMEFRLEAVKLKGAIDTTAYQNQIKLYDRMSKAIDEKVKDKEGITHRLSPEKTSELREEFWREELVQSKGMSPEWYRLHFPDLPEKAEDIKEGEMYMAIKDGKWVVVKITTDGYEVVKGIE